MTTTTTVPATVDTTKVAEYVAADTSGKAKIRKALEVAQHQAVMVDADIVTARNLAATLEACLASSKISKSVEVDITAQVASRMQAFAVADLMLQTFTADLDVERLMDLLAERPSADEVIAGWALAESTKVGARKVAKGISLDAHLAEVVEAHEPGTVLTVAEIVKFESTVAPNGLNSSGAVAARLNAESGCTFEGVTVLPRIEGERPLSVMID